MIFFSFLSFGGYDFAFGEGVLESAVEFLGAVAVEVHFEDEVDVDGVGDDVDEHFVLQFFGEFLDDVESVAM